jgi:two-component system, OmpR family, KDP operon response regulator KdpE
MTKSVRALLLYEDNNRCKRLRTTIFGAGAEVEEEPFDPQTTARMAKGYGIVLFSIRRPEWRFFEILRTWHDHTPETTLVVVSCRTSQSDRLAALEAGASAYLTEPVTAAELAAHVREALRRFQARVVPVYQLSFGHTIVDLKEHLVRTGEKQIHLTRTQCRILEYLAAHPNQTVPCKDLVKVLWGSDPRKGSHSLRCFIRQLRQKLEPDPANPQYLVNDPTNGYRLQIPGTYVPSTRPRRPTTISRTHASREAGENIREMSLGRLRTAIRNNRISFPSQIPSFSCQPMAEIEWRLAGLFFIHGWPCADLGLRYGLCKSYVEKRILHWARRSILVGYLQKIPDLEWPGDSTVDLVPDSQAGSGTSLPLNHFEPRLVAAPQWLIDVTTAQT